jgi:HK97 family phage prohead protease
MCGHDAALEDVMSHREARPEIERRVVTASIEVRAKDKTKMLVGYGAMFGVRSEDLGGFVEEIAPGAFDESLRGNVDVLARGEHDSRMLLGRRSNGTLRLSIDNVGLRYEVDPPDTTAARDLMTLVERGDVKQSSFAFFIENREDEAWSVTAEGTPLRTLKRVALVDVAPVAQPAYLQTTVSARALDTAKGVVQPMKPVKPKPTRATFEEALKRGLFRHLKEEQRAKSYEEKLEAIYMALYALLGDPWSYEDPATPWSLEATFDDRVIIEIGYQMLSYPLSWGADGAPIFGNPTPVEIEYVDISAAVAVTPPPAQSTATLPGASVSPAAAEGGYNSIQAVNENRLKLAAS